MEGKDIQYVAGAVGHFRVKKLYDKDGNGEGKGGAAQASSGGSTTGKQHKVELMVDPLFQHDLPGYSQKGTELAMLMRATMEKIIEEAGGQRLTGAPPRGPLERQLQHKLELMQRRS